MENMNERQERMLFGKMWNGGFVVNCRTQKGSDEVLAMLEKYGVHWWCPVIQDTGHLWKTYAEDTAYYIDHLLPSGTVKVTDVKTVYVGRISLT